MVEPQGVTWLDEAPSENITWLDETPNAEVMGEATQKRSINDALTQAFSFTPGSAFNLVAGLGGAMQSATMPVKSPIEVWKPKEVERGRSILGLAGAVAKGAIALPALFTLEGAVSPALEKYARGEDITAEEAISEGVIGVIDKIGELLGNTEDAPGFARAMVTALEQQDSPTVLGMKIETPEQRQAVGQLVAAGAYLAVMPSTLREVGARAKALPRIAKERGMFNENVRALTAELKIKNPDMPPDAVKSLAEYLTNRRLSGKADIVMEQTTIKPNAIKTATSTMEAKARAMIEGVISKDVKGGAIKPAAPKIPDISFTPTEGGKVVYHGTFSDFQEFDPSKLGESTGAPSAKEGFFFATNKNVAESYGADLTKRLRVMGDKAVKAEEQIVVLTGDSRFTAIHKLRQNKYSSDVAKKVENELRKIDAYEDLEAGVSEMSMGYTSKLARSGKVKEVTLDMKNPLIHDMKGSDFRDMSYVDIIKKAKAAGHDSVIIKNTYDGANPVAHQEMTDVHIVFDKSQIKLSPTEGKAEPLSKERIKPDISGITPIQKDIDAMSDRMEKIERARTELYQIEDIHKFLIHKIKKYVTKSRAGLFMQEELKGIPAIYITTEETAMAPDEIREELAEKGVLLADDVELKEFLINMAGTRKSLKDTIDKLQPQLVTKRETTLLAQRIRAAEQGIRQGKKISREEIKTLQSDIIALLKSSDLEAKDRAKFLDTIKNIQTQEQLEKAIPTIVGRMARLESMEMRRGVKADIAKELKYTKPVKSGQKKVGKYDYESNKFFEEIRGIAKTSQAEAQVMLDAMPKEGLTDIELIKARILSLQANGMDASLELYNQVLNDIQTLKVIGMASKDDADFNKRMLRRERAEEVLEAVKKIKGSKDTVTGKIANAYRLGFSNTYSLLNSIAGKDTAEKYDPEMKENTRDTAMFAKTKEVAIEASNIFGLDSPAKIAQSLQDMASEKFELTDIEGLTTEITKLQILDIYNSIKNDLVRERYYNAFGEKQVTDMIGNLSAEEKRFGDYIQEVVQEYRDILNQRHIEITGRDLGFVENYWPATSEYEPDVFDDIKMQGETPSALKERAKSGKVFPKPKDAWMKMQKHIAQAEHVKELSREYEMLKKLFSDRHVKNAIETKFGEKVYQSLMDRIDYISLNKRTEQVDAVSGVYGKMMANWVAAKIANPTVFARQLVSVINYAETMPTGEWAKGFVKGLLTPKQTFDFMWKNAPFLEARFNRGYSEALKDAIKGADSLTNSLHKNWLHGLTSLTRAGDISAIIYGGYSYVVHEMKTKPIEEVMKNFETITLKSQQSGVTSGLSPFQNTSNPIARVLLAFKNTANQYLRKQVDAMIAYGNGDIDATQLAKTTIIYSIINPLLYLAMGAVVGTAFWKATGRFFRGESSDTDWGEVWSGAAVHMIANPFNAIPLVEDVAQLAGKKLMGQKIYKVFDTPMMDDLEGAFRAISKKDITLLDWAKFLGTGAEVTTGTPINTGLRIYKSLVGEKPKKKRSRITSPF